jgi:hypothetical protein
MKRLIVLSMAITAVLMAGSFGSAIAEHHKPLCEFFASYNPGVIGSGLLVYYDGRDYDEYWFSPGQRSTGGMKFVIELGYWLSPSERDAIANIVEKVEFKNISKGTKYVIRDAFKFSYTQTNGVPTFNADYVVVLGNGQNFIGEWEVKLVALQQNGKGKADKNVYTAKFDITESMVMGKPIVKISDIFVKQNPSGVGYQVCFTPSNPQNPFMYKVRMINGNDIVYDQTYGGNLTPPLCPTVPAGYLGMDGRVEARLLYGFMLSCPDNILVGSDGATGPDAQMSRESLYFKLIP